MAGKKLIIGNEEWCAFPTLGIPAIKARTDSGAKTSAIHAVNIHPFKRGQGTWVKFEVHPLQKDRKTTVYCEAVVLDRRSLKSSSGCTEKRYVIRVPMRIGKHTWEIELTLTNRDSMGYRMLLGREAMAYRILIDPTGSFYFGKKTTGQINRLYNFTY